MTEKKKPGRTSGEVQGDDSRAKGPSSLDRLGAFAKRVLAVRKDEIREGELKSKNPRGDKT